MDYQIGQRVLRKHANGQPHPDARGQLVRGTIRNVGNDAIQVQWDSEWIPLEPEKPISYKETLANQRTHQDQLAPAPGTEGF